MRKKIAVIFDLDGTLIHSAPDMQTAINTALQPIGRGPLELSTVISFVGNGVERLVERSLMFTGGSHPDLQRETVARFLAAYEANGVARTHVYPGVLQQLKHLRSAGLKLGLCTNKPMEPTRHICDALQLSPFFTSLVGATPSRPKKPDPA
ncbi:MAG: HAD hydrolase-like protein, partial [Pseudomonadota bacterium]